MSHHAQGLYFDWIGLDCVPEGHVGSMGEGVAPVADLESAAVRMVAVCKELRAMSTSVASRNPEIFIPMPPI